MNWKLWPRRKLLVQDGFSDAIAANTGLHSWVMLTGKRGRHYLILPEDLANLMARVENEPEIKCRWN